MELRIWLAIIILSVRGIDAPMDSLIVKSVIGDYVIDLVISAFIPAQFLRSALFDLIAFSHMRPSRAAPRRGLGKSVTTNGILLAAVFNFQNAARRI